MFLWCRGCIWQTLVANCVNVCIHVNKSSFKPMSMILFISSALSSLWAQQHLSSGPLHEQPPQNCCHLLWKLDLCPCWLWQSKKKSIVDDILPNTHYYLYSILYMYEDFKPRLYLKSVIGDVYIIVKCFCMGHYEVWGINIYTKPIHMYHILYI